MDPQLVRPFIISHVIALLYVIAAWRWARATRYVTGAGFAFAGVFNSWWAASSPAIYVTAYGPHAIPLYREFIHGAFARPHLSSPSPQGRWQLVFWRLPLCRGAG